MDLEKLSAIYYGNRTTAPTGGIPPLSGYANTAEMVLYQFITGSWRPKYTLAVLPDTFLLLETGDVLLLEAGDKLVLEI